MEDRFRALVAQVRDLPPEQQVEFWSRRGPGEWSSMRRGFTNAPFHWEWYRLMMSETRCVTIAPREHAKTEVWTINQTAWRSIYQPGTYTYVFGNTLDQAKKLKARIDAAIAETSPDLLVRMPIRTSEESEYANGSFVVVAGAGKAVRGAHPDIIIGDDVLEEGTCATSHQRKKTEKWWMGTVANMAHPGTQRTIGGKRIWFPATKVFLVGTPFHRSDLLMSMRENPMYSFHRYAAEFAERDLVKGSLAVEAA